MTNSTQVHKCFLKTSHIGMENTRPIRTVPQRGAPNQVRLTGGGQNPPRCKQDRVNAEIETGPTGPGAWGQGGAGSRGQNVTSTQRAPVPMCTRAL